jgi:8-oxo-dGTP pyrophosphatase MutT (NUDIX family)
MAAVVQLPEITVATVVERDGRFLFVEERIRGALVLNQPAGRLDPGESVVEGAVRETLEETAWEVDPLGLIAVYQWRSPFDGAEVLRFTFAARPLRQHHDRVLDHGIERALWLSRDELLRHQDRLRTPMVLHSVDDYLSSALLPLSALRRIESAAAPR